MHDEDGNWVGMKAAQMTFTQTALDRALFTIDVKGISVVYFLPKKNPDAADFSRSKFDTLLKLSPHVESMFSDVRNVGHKQAGGVDFFLRGIRSRSGAKSISTGVTVYDELDEMIMKNVVLASERQSGYESADKQSMKLSTPTIPKFGISLEYDNSCQQHYFFTCPRCGRRTEFVYPDCLVITADSSSDEAALKKSYLRCLDCKKKIHDEEREIILHYNVAKWETIANSQASTRGFQINQMYSIVMGTWEFAKFALQSQEDPNYEQEFWNSKLGLPFIQKGAKIEEAQLLACLGGYKTTTKSLGGLVTMGVDQGHREFYYEISESLIPPVIGRQINLNSVTRVLASGTVPEMVMLDRLMREYQVLHCVIDVDPYMRDAINFAMRFPGRVNLCRFVRGIERNGIAPQESDFLVHVNRTSWLDMSQGRFKIGAGKQGGIMIPNDVSTAYKEHIKSLVRVTKVNKEGNLVSIYVSMGPDHFAFAHVYNEMALPLAVSARENKDIGNFL